jgi:hypothetical protein
MGLSRRDGTAGRLDLIGRPENALYFTAAPASAGTHHRSQDRARKTMTVMAMDRNSQVRPERLADVARNAGSGDTDNAAGRK